MRNVRCRIEIRDSFHGAVKCWIKKVGAACCVPLQPGVRSQISEMMFADHEANMRRAIRPQDGIEQDGLALTIGGDIGVDLRGRLPLRGIFVGDRAQAG